MRHTDSPFFIRPLRFLQQMNLTACSTLGIAMMLFLIITVAASAYLAMFFVRDAQQSIDRSTEIQRLVLEMDRGMETAWRLQSDFLLQYSRIGLANAHVRYAQPSARKTAEVIVAGNELKKRIQQAGIGNAIRKAHVDLNLYFSFAKRFADTAIQSVELVTELEAPERGLESQLVSCLDQLQHTISTNRDLFPLFVEMKQDIQEYRINRKRYQMQSAFNVASRIRETASTVDMPRDVQGNIGHLLDRLQNVSTKMAAIHATILAYLNDFALQADAVNHASKALTETAKNQVQQAQHNIEHARLTGIVMITVTSLIGVLAALGIARNLYNSITRRLLNLTRTAEAMKSGNLTGIADESGSDELSRLGAIFNSMSAHLRETLDHLENRVEERTAALVDSERRFREFFENSPSGIVIYQAGPDAADFRIRDINRTGEKIDNVNRMSVLGKMASEVYPGIEDTGLLDVFRSVWQTGVPVRNKVSSYLDGQRLRWLENTVFKLPAGEIASVFNDITEKKQAETEKPPWKAACIGRRKWNLWGFWPEGWLMISTISFPVLLDIPNCC